MKKLPKFLKEYFWDVDFDKIDPEKRSVYILKRILNYGDEKAVLWMFKHFRKEEIMETLIKYRDYSKKSANYWALILGIPKDEVLCLKTRSKKEQKTFWPH